MGKKDHKIGFAHVINIQDSCENTKYGILEHDTIGQANNKLWMKERALRITSSQAHKIIIRKKNYDNLAKSLIDDSNNQKFPKFVKDAMAFGTKYESVAKSKFFDYMTYQLKRK